MSVAHDPEPLVAASLPVAVQQLSNAVDENFGTAARYAVETRCDQPLDDRRNGNLIQPGNVQDFRRRQRVQLEGGIPRLHSPEQILVPRNRQIGVVTTLQQQLVAADGNRLVNLAEDLVEGENVSIGCANGTI